MNTHDIEPMKYGGNRSDDYVTGWNDCRAAIEADRRARNCGQCVPLSADGTAVFIDGVCEVPLDFSGQARGEPVAYISGWHNGYLTIKMLDPSFLPHDNMALYAKPQPTNQESE